MDYPSKVLAKAVEEISGLPGIGKKSALRLALHLLKQPASQAVALGDSLKKLKHDEDSKKSEISVANPFHYRANGFGWNGPAKSHQHIPIHLPQKFHAQS